MNRTDVYSRYRSVVLSCLLLTIAASLSFAQDHSTHARPGDEVRQYRKVETAKVCQLTGEWDGQFARLTSNQTWTRFKLGATDLGASFLHGERLWFLFGDSMPTGPSENDGLNHQCGDAIATSATPLGSTCPELDFLTHPNTEVFQSPVIRGVDLGCYNVPTDGVSVDGRMYVWFTTDGMKRSVLSRYDEASMAFGEPAGFSDRHFINVSAESVSVQRNSGFPGTDSDWIVLFGSGEYRKSQVYLAVVPASGIADLESVSFYKSVEVTSGRPTWTSDETQAEPILPDTSPCVGELSAHYDEAMSSWVLLYNCDSPRGVLLYTAAEPWGPWSAAEIVFDPWADNGYCHFIHRACSPQEGDCCDDLAPPGFEGDWGGEYGPYAIEPLTQVEGASGRVTLYYVLSTWIPYNTVVMRTVLEEVGSTGFSGAEESTSPDYALHQNFPNPVREATTISYALRQHAEATLTVYDVLGRRIRELASGVRPAGTHEVSFDAADLAAGVYFYRLETREYVETKRMVVVE